MKKLLLILICLFVSFEVKSESDGSSDEKFLEEMKNSQSDDLDGKKLLCFPVTKKGYTNKKEPLIFEFLPNFSLSTYKGDPINNIFLKHQGRYYNDLETIIIKYLYSVNEYHYKINRQNLKIYDTLFKLTPKPHESKLHSTLVLIDHFKCDLFEEDINLFFEKYFDENKKEKDNYQKKLKLKQKKLKSEQKI